jgi:small subunit ribosomal protein S16
MALKIRLRQQGRTNRQSYRLVVTDSRNPRDGRYVETVGWYNPLEVDPEKTFSVKEDRVQYWVGQGAIMTEKSEALIARAAPSIIKIRQEKEVARRAKIAAKRKTNRKIAAA